jgi:hypothetical protein
MTESVTVQLPQEAFERLRRRAGAARKPLEEFLVDRLMDAVPSLPENVSPSLREELDALEELDETALQKVAESRLPLGRQRTNQLREPLPGLPFVQRVQRCPSRLAGSLQSQACPVVPPTPPALE